MNLSDPFKSVLSNATNLGAQLLQKEIDDHGNQQPATRPAEQQTVTAPAEPRMSKKTMLMIGGGVAAAVVLVLILKKK